MIELGWIEADFVSFDPKLNYHCGEGSMESAQRAGVAERVNRLILEYAQVRPAEASAGALDGKLTLRGDLAIDSLALVSLTIRVGEEFEVDVVESGLDFSQLETVRDLQAIAEKLERR
ncbi:MAG TPA: acyl carrier protein [Polyangia bacterium]|nr:acyl carrier protein [Polyangia bacterium]